MKARSLDAAALFLVSLLVSIPPLRANAQGIFTYNFVLDDSPWKVYALFQADSTAVASGYLAETNTFGGYMTQGGRTAPLRWIDMPVDPITGALTGSLRDTRVEAYFDLDAFDIEGVNVPSLRNSYIVYWPWVGSPAESLSGGWWNVRFTPTPEPNSLSLLGLGLLALAVHRK